LSGCKEPTLHQANSVMVIESNTSTPQENIVPEITATPSGLTPDQFLRSFHLDVQFEPKKFKVDVPSDWSLKPGDYPLSLYWRLANVFSEDVGLDLNPLKGSSIEVWQYALRGGLPGREGDHWTIL
jgi:hypothetical protein